MPPRPATLAGALLLAALLALHGLAMTGMPAAAAPHGHRSAAATSPVTHGSHHPAPDPAPEHPGPVPPASECHPLPPAGLLLPGPPPAIATTADRGTSPAARPIRSAIPQAATGLPPERGRALFQVWLL